MNRIELKMFGGPLCVSKGAFRFWITNPSIYFSLKAIFYTAQCSSKTEGVCIELNSYFFVMKT